MKKYFFRKAAATTLAMALIVGTGVPASANTYVNADTVSQPEANPSIVLDADDFETFEEYQNYLALQGKSIEDVSELDPFLEFNSNGISTMSVSNAKAVSATKRYTITGLTYGTAIQKAYIDSSYIYTIQRSGSTICLSRCEISGTTAKYKDRMILNEFGHSQTLECFTYGGKTCFWIACKASTDTDSLWSTQIARVPYEAGVTKSYTAFKRLSSVTYANKTGTSHGTTKRTDAALSSNGKTLLIWSKNTKNTTDSMKTMQFALYDAAKINKALDESTTNYLSCADSKVKNACISSFQKDSSILSSGSCQGLELTDADSIYIASGQLGTTKYVLKLSSTGGDAGTIYLKDAALKASTKTEIEGLQLKGDYVYMGICDHSTSPKGQYIYSVPKSAF